jgi:serine/threonine protein kinase
MAANPPAHPSAEILRLLAVGKLDDAAAREVRRHLETCPSCRRAAAAAPADGLAAHGGTRASAGALSDFAGSPPTTTEAPGIAGLPAELAGNPHYQVFRELGKGGMGVVYLASNVLMDRLEVLKVVNRALLDQPASVERFLQEIRAAAKLNHDNVVKAYSALALGELLVFAMEFVEGEDLARLVKRLGPLPLPNACFYALQAALGLQHAHENGLVHRDIKPANLILSKKGKKQVVKILDFGLAKASRERQTDGRLTVQGAIMGTPDYIAPEQTMDAAAADIRADIYSLGCTLYFLLAGRPPFQGDTPISTILCHVQDPPQPLPELRPEVPAELWTVVVKMLAKDPSQRYQKPAEVAQALAPFVKAAVKAAPGTEMRIQPGQGKTPARPVPVGQDSLTVGDERNPLPPPPPPRRPATPATRKWWLIGGTVAVAMLLVGLVGLWARGVLFRVKTDAGVAAEDDESRAEASPKEGFVSLFNGKDLTGWKAHPIGKARWEVKDGILTGSGDIGHLFYTANSYENFHVRVEAMINDGGNSGVYFRTPFGPTLPQGYPRGGYEVEINSTSKDPHKTGSLRVHNQLAVGVTDPAVEPNEWFTLEVLADGPHLVVKVNGRTTADYVDAAPHSRVGQIALQVLDAATIVKFRKVEIKELPPGELRLRWQLTDGGHLGRFDQVKGNIWIERGDGGKHVLFWREIGRTEDLVSLNISPDGAGEAWVHLRREAYFYRSGGGGWRKFADGRWAVRERVPPPKKSPAARIGEWVPLFSGTGLDGWDSEFGSRASWKFKDGILVGQSKGPNPRLLVTRRADYDHFHLRMETMLSEGQNGWVLVRCGPPEDGAGGYQSYAVPVGGTRKSPAAMGNHLFIAAHRSRPFLLCAAPRVAHKPNEWFPLEVHAQGNRLRVLIDGKNAVDYVDPNETFTAGRLGLYCLGNTVVRFRNIQIKELPPPVESGPTAGAAADAKGFVSLFNGKDLTGWEVHPQKADNWEVKDGILACRRGPESYLFSERDDYQDFHLRVEARINLPGNSGVYFWSAPGKPRPLGLEVEIAGPETGAVITTGARTLAAVTDRLMVPGEWFTLEVIAQGNRVRTLINGKTAMNTTLWVKYRARGHIALQHLDPKTVIEFRKVEIKELPGTW